MEQITPTNRCFDDALDFLAAVVSGDDRDAYCLAHGILVHPVTKEEFVHAWVEKKDPSGRVVYHSFLQDGVLTYGEFLQERFYKLFGVKERTLYTIREAWTQNWKHGNYGPWKEKYRKLAAPRGSIRKDH